MGKKRKFYRATLPTIVWNPNTGKALAEFVDGQFITDDEEIAETLKGKGYPEVKMDAPEPPMLIPDPVPITSPDVKVMSPGMTEAAMADKIKREDEGVEDKGPGFTAVGESLVTDDGSSDASDGADLTTDDESDDDSAADKKPKVVAKAKKKKETVTDKRRKIKRRKK